MPLENQGGPAPASAPPPPRPSRRCRSRWSNSRRSPASRPGWRRWKPPSVPSRKPPGRSRPASWPRRVKWRTRCGCSASSPSRQLQRRAAEVRPGRGAGQAVRAGRRGLTDPGRAQPRSGRRRAARPSLAEPVRGRCPGRVLRRAHADVPDGGRVRLAAARPAGICPLPPGVEPRGDGHRPDDPGGPDAARRPDTGCRSRGTWARRSSSTCRACRRHRATPGPT